MCTSSFRQRQGIGRLRLAVCALVCSGVMGPALLHADLEGTGLTPAQEVELRYADRLLDAGLPDYAGLILQRLNLPAAIMAIREIRSFTARGRFEEARAVVEANPGRTQEAMALKLTLADGYYAWGRYDQAQALYEAFFQAFPDGPEESIKSFFMNSAYRYAKMMELTGNRKAAADAYRMALRANPERHVQRQIQSELAELLMLKARDASGADRQRLLNEVNKIAEDILWVQDLWFGRAIVLLAHMRVLQNNIDGAMRLVEDYTSQLRSIDQVLRAQAEETGEDLTRLSPMAQCRYMIGEILHDHALEILAEGGDQDEALQMLIGRQTSAGQQVSGAVQHFANVFIRYPNTSWAPHAGNRFRQVEEVLHREFGRQVNIQITREQWEEVERAQFREARALFNQGRFPEASENYLQVLSLFPERTTSIPALGELAESLIEQESFTMADAVVRHLAERFNQNTDLTVEAGNQVIRVAGKYLEVGRTDKQRETFDVFFAYFRAHPRTLLDLQRFAREALSAENHEVAIRYFAQIIADFQGRPAYYDALSQMARIFLEREDRANKTRMLLRLITELDAANIRNHLRVSAAFRLATHLRGMGPDQIDQAQSLFRSLRDMLEGAQAAAYAANAAEAEANARILQGAMFYAAITDAMRTTVPDPVRQGLERRAERALSDTEILNNFYKAGAIRQLNQLVERFPQSPFSPAALSQIGTLNTFLQRAEEAAAALRRLERDYPDSPEAANAVFMIGRNLLEMGMRDEAVRYFKQMFEGDIQYPMVQILTAGQELLEANEYQIALEAFERVIAGSQDRRLLEPARVGQGQALFGLERYQDAAACLDRVIADYPQSGHTITICRTASEANAKLASRTEGREERTVLFNRSVELMRRAMQFAQDPGVQAQLEVAVAGILERRAEAEERFGNVQRARDFRNEALAAYQTIMMFRDGSHPAVAPHMQVAYSRAVPMMIAMERWQDVFDDAQGYLEKFPNGRYAGAMRQAITTARLQGDISD